MKTVTRNANRVDLERVLKLNKRLFEYERKFDRTYNLNWTYSPRGRTYFAGRLENGIIIVAEVNKSVIGYLCAFIDNYSFRSTNPIAEIENMFIEEKYRGQGIGSKLVDNLIRQLESKGVKRIKVGALTKNSRTVDFYRKNKFNDHEVILERSLE